MDNNLYIVGAFGVLLVIVIGFYFFTTNKTENMENSQIQQHMEEDHGMECDGDKCFVK